MGLIKKSWNCSLECGAAAAMAHGTLKRRATGAGPVLHSTRAGCGECELCGGSGAGSHGGGMGLAGRPRGARSAPLEAGMQMGPRACRVRGVKGSQMR